MRCLLWLACTGPLLLVGCGKDSASLSDIKEWLMAFPNPSAHPNDPVLARMGDNVVRASEFRSYVQSRLGLLGPRAATTDRRQWLEQLLYEKATDRLAREAGVQIDPAKRLMLAEMEHGYLMSAFIKQIPLSDDEMRAYYQIHAREFIPPEAMISHVRVGSPAQARKIRALLEKGKSVPGMQRNKVSQTPSPRNLSGIQFVNAVFALKPGQVAGPLQTRWGFEMVRREVLPPSSALPFEAVKEQVRARAQAAKLVAIYSHTRSTQKLEVDEKLLNSL